MASTAAGVTVAAMRQPGPTCSACSVVHPGMVESAVRVAATSAPSKSQMFAASNRPAELVAVDATMPEHKHSMNYRPTILGGKDGRYRVDGLIFHMPGLWELSIDVRAGEESERLTHDFILK